MPTEMRKAEITVKAGVIDEEGDGAFPEVAAEREIKERLQ